MTDGDLERVLREGPVRAVLLAQRRWLHGPQVRVTRAWASEGGHPAMWRIDLCDESTYHSFFTEAVHIVGVSIERAAASGSRPV